MNDKTHISQTDLYAFNHNIMNQKDKEIFLEHICSCDYCSDQFATMMSDETIKAPKDMKANILKATKQPEIQLTNLAKKTSKKMQLFIYSLKVGAGTAVALLLLIFSTKFTDVPNSILSEKSGASMIIVDENTVPLTSVIRDNMDSISNNMLDFSNNIMKTEVTNYDQKEK